MAKKIKKHIQGKATNRSEKPKKDNNPAPSSPELCSRCKTREAKVTYSSDYMSYVHGFISRICRQCYIKELETTIKNAETELIKQLEELKKEEEQQKK